MMVVHSAKEIVYMEVCARQPFLGVFPIKIHADTWVFLEIGAPQNGFLPSVLLQNYNHPTRRPPFLNSTFTLRHTRWSLLNCACDKRRKTLAHLPARTRTPVMSATLEWKTPGESEEAQWRNQSLRVEKHATIWRLKASKLAFLTQMPSGFPGGKKGRILSFSGWLSLKGTLPEKEEERAPLGNWVK